MSALPKAVKAQIDKANKILEDMGKDPNDPENPESGADPNAAAEPAKEPAKEPDPNAAQPTQAKPEPPAGEPAKDGWEHKYNVLQGKYNAEVPRLQKDLQASNELVSELRQRQNNLEAMIASIKTTQQEPKKDPAPPKSRITQEEIEAFGPDLADFINRAAEDVADRIVAERMKGVQKEVGEVKKSTSQVSRTVADSKREQTIQALADAVPDWEKQNEDPNFLKWLDEVDPYSSQKRGLLLSRAFNAHNARTVIALFQGYLNENAAVTPEPSSDTPDPAPEPKKEPQTKMEDLVAPGAPSAPTAGAPTEAGKGRTWSQAEVANLYAKKNEFIKKGKPVPEELVKLEKDLFKAQTEGRLRA